MRQEYFSPIQLGIALVTKATGLGDVADCADCIHGEGIWKYLDALLDVMDKPKREDVKEWSTERKQKVSVLRGKKKRGKYIAHQTVLQIVDDLLPLLTQIYGEKHILVDVDTPFYENNGKWEVKEMELKVEDKGSATNSQGVVEVEEEVSRLVKCFVKHVSLGKFQLPPLELLTVEDTLRERFYFAGPAFYGGILSVADFLFYSIFHAYSDDFIQNGIIRELPNCCRFMENFRKIDEVAAIIPVIPSLAEYASVGGFNAHDEGKAVKVVIGKGSKRKQEKPKGARRVANDSYTLEPVWFGKNSEEYQVNVSNSVEMKKRRQRTMPVLVAKTQHMLMHHTHIDNLGDRCKDKELYQLALKRIASLWTCKESKILDPSAGNLNSKRADSKRIQIECLARSIALLLKPGHVIVEFGSGGGHVGLCLSYCFPQCTVLLSERNLFSVVRAQRRIESLGFANVECCVGDMADFKGIPFNVGVGLHFCGYLTDLAMDVCVRERASFVFCPCCYGKIAHNVVEEIDENGQKSFKKVREYPKSKTFHDSSISDTEFFFFAACADDETTKTSSLLDRTKHQQNSSSNEHDNESKDHVKECDHTHDDVDDESGIADAIKNVCAKYDKLGRVCMGVVDSDRLYFAQENGYDTILTHLDPLECTPRNNILIGIAPSLSS
eukprot:m.28279 g.28279  ORF g.28279 m.28279 type:complete len:666 (-) comp6031_c0_seq1:113-2110(-)